MGLFDLPIISDVSDLFGGGNAGEANTQAILDAWKKLQGQANVPYQTPDNTFAGQNDVLGRLNQQSQTGLTDQDKYAFWQARQQAGDFANQRQGAVQQQAAMQGGGVANSGQNAVMQSQAAQQGANRLQGADMGQAAESNNRRYQATLNYMQGLQGMGNQQFRNANALNQFNQQNFGNQMGATAGLSGAYQNQANYQQQMQEQRRQAGQKLWNNFAPDFAPGKQGNSYDGPMKLWGSLWGGGGGGGGGGGAGGAASALSGIVAF